MIVFDQINQGFTHSLMVVGTNRVDAFQRISWIIQANQWDGMISPKQFFQMVEIIHTDDSSKITLLQMAAMICKLNFQGDLPVGSDLA